MICVFIYIFVVYVCCSKLGYRKCNWTCYWALKFHCFSCRWNCESWLQEIVSNQPFCVLTSPFRGCWWHGCILRISRHCDLGSVPAPCSCLTKVTVTYKKSVQFDSIKHRRLFSWYSYFLLIETLNPWEVALTKPPTGLSGINKDTF